MNKRRWAVAFLFGQAVVPLFKGLMEMWREGAQWYEWLIVIAAAELACWSLWELWQEKV